MPFDSNGIWSLTPGYLAVTGQVVSPTNHNPPLEDISTNGLSLVLVRDGRAPMTGPLNMGTTNKIVNLATPTAGTDGATKAYVDSVSGSAYTSKSGNYTVIASDSGFNLRWTTAATVSLTAAGTLGTSFRCRIIAGNGQIVIDPNGSETINGTATLILTTGQSAYIICDGTSFFAVLEGDTQSGPQIQGYITGLTIANNVADATNDIDIAVGAAASDISPYYNMQLTSALTKQLDSAWAVGNNAGMRDTGAIADGWWYIYEIQRSDTGVVDILASLSATAPTMPTNYDRKRRIAAIFRTGAAIKPFAQFSDRYVSWATPVLDLNTTTPSTTGALLTLTVPPVNGTLAKLGLQLFQGGVAYVWARETGQVNVASGALVTDVSTDSAAARSLSEITRHADASGQIRYRSSTASVSALIIETKGFTLPV